MARSGGCPKCGGSMLPERQVDGSLEYCCLQCGRMLTRQEVLQLTSRGKRGAGGIATLTLPAQPDPVQSAEEWLAT